jgi:hypothetical protein
MFVQPTGNPASDADVPVTRLKRKERRTGFTVIRMRSLNDPHQGSLPTVHIAGKDDGEALWKLMGTLKNSCFSRPVRI